MSALSPLKATVAAALVAGSLSAHAIVAIPVSPVSSTFETDADGWTGITSPDGAPTWTLGSTHLLQFVDTDGNPSGSVRFTDPDAGWSFFRAPEKFRGDLSSFTGGTLRFDLRTVVAATPVNSPEVILKGASLTIEFEATDAPPSTWTQFSIPLVAGEWRVSGSNVLATPEQVSTVLGGVQELWINAEHFTPVTETIGLDNVMLTPVPEPSQAALLLAGVGLIGWRLARRRSAAA